MMATLEKSQVWDVLHTVPVPAEFDENQKDEMQLWSRFYRSMSKPTVSPFFYRFDCTYIEEEMIRMGDKSVEILAKPDSELVPIDLDFDMSELEQISRGIVNAVEDFLSIINDPKKKAKIYNSNKALLDQIKSISNVESCLPDYLN